MMTVLILSDTHGKLSRLESVLRRTPKPDAVFFLGDGRTDFDRVSEPFSTLFSVRGNCDWFLSGAHSDEPTERIVTLDGVRCLLMHGHTAGVKSGTERAEKTAMEAGCDILLYGHTHARDDRVIPYPDGERVLHVFNPGSVGQDPDGDGSFGVLTIRENGFLLSHGEV